MLPLSVWAQDLIDHVTEHMDGEREALTAYRDLAAQSPDDRVRYLAMQVLEDEVRHHQQLADLRDALREEVERRGPPHRDGRRMPAVTRQRLVDLTEELLALEHDDLKELRRLAREVRKVADTAWRATVVEAMELDTRKHVKLLEEIRHILRESPP